MQVETENTLPIIDIGVIVSENANEECWELISEKIGQACLNYGTVEFD
jgi:hypothetical protein